MDAAQKSFQLQSQLRQNAENLKTTLKDLYNWEKEIKSKEQELQRHEAGIATAKQDSDAEAPPVRSHMQVGTATKLLEKTATSAPPIKETVEKFETPTEKVEMPIDPNEEKRKQANAIKERGNELVKLREYVKAIKEYTEAIDVFPEDACFYTNRALCYLKLKKYYDCIEDCERAIEIDSLAIKAYYRRMLANEELGNDRNALKDCTTILVIDPNNKDAKISLERINKTLRANVKSITGPNFCPVRSDMCFIEAIDKPPHARSKKLLLRVPITDVVGPKDSKNQSNSNMQVTDEVIDKLFNSDCGPFVEVKKETENIKTNTKKSTPGVKQTKKSPPKAKQTMKSPQNVVESDTHSLIDMVQFKKYKESIAAEAQEENQTENLNQTEKEIKIEKANETQKEEQTEEVKQTVTEKQIEKIDSNKIANASINTPVNSAEQKAGITNTINADKPVPVSPASTAQFYANWKELSPAQKYQYLKSIEVRNLCKILGASFDSDTLTDVINTLHDFYMPNKETNLAATLLAVSKNNQLAILSLLMSTEERKAITEILNSIKESKAHTATAALIAKNFNLQ